MELARTRETETGVNNEEASGSDDEDVPRTPEDEEPGPHESGQRLQPPAEEDSEAARDPRTRVLSVLELEGLFFQVAPDLTSTSFNPSVRPS